MPPPCRAALSVLLGALSLLGRAPSSAANVTSCVPAWGCACSERNVDCSDLGLVAFNASEQWPPSLPQGTRLVLTRNALVDVPREAFASDRLAGVHSLDLSYNALGRIADDSFSDLSQLRHLQLEHNQLTAITSRTLAGLANLERLDISYNRLRNLSSDAFASCAASLRHLVLSYNPFQELEPELLFPLVLLEILDLNNVGLSTLDDDTFANTSQLVELDLAGNQLDEVPTEALRSLENLLRLDLSDNAFASVSAHAFDGLYNLEQLKLDTMERLERVDAHAFQELYNLQILECSFNRRLSFVHADAFRSPEAKRGEYTGRVRELRLRQNALTTLDRLLLPWMRVGTVDLQENPWHCDCRLQWMKTIVAHKDSSGPNVRCHSPSSLSGRRVDEVGSSEFECSDQSEHALLSVALFLVAFMAVAGVVGGLGCWKMRACAKCRETYQQRYKKLGTSSETGVEMASPRNDTRDVEV